VGNTAYVLLRKEGGSGEHCLCATEEGGREWGTLSMCY